MSKCDLCHKSDTYPKVGIPMHDGTGEKRVHKWHDPDELPNLWKWLYFQMVPLSVAKSPSWQREQERLRPQYGHLRPIQIHEQPEATKQKAMKKKVR